MALHSLPKGPNNDGLLYMTIQTGVRIKILVALGTKVRR